MNANFGSELSQQQIDQALSKLQMLMKGEEKVTNPNNQSDILRSIQKMALEVAGEDKEQENHPKITIAQINQLIGRIYDKHQQTQDKIQQQRDQLRSQSPFKPQLSEQSQRIIQKKIQSGEYQPIQYRAQQIMLEKRQKHQEYQKLKSQVENEEKSQYTFRPNVHAECEPRSVDQFLEQVDYWIMKKNQTLQQQQQEKLEREMVGATFKPRVNKNSEKIVSESRELNTSVQERLQKSTIQKQLKEKKMIEEELKKTPFAPKLNNNSLKILNKRQTQKPQRKQHNYANQNLTMLDRSYDYKARLKESFTPVAGRTRASGEGEGEYIKSSRDHYKVQMSRTPQQSRANVSFKNIGQQLTPTRMKSPLRNNKSVVNQPQEIKYSPNLKFIVDLLERKTAKALF